MPASPPRAPIDPPPVAPSPGPLPPSKWRRARYAMVAGMVAVLVVSVGVVAAWLNAGERTPAAPPRSTALTAAEDTYLLAGQGGVDHSADPELIAGTVDGKQATAYLKFEVPPLAEPGRIAGARVEASSAGAPPIGLRLVHVPDTTWSADELGAAGPPAHGPVVADGQQSGGGLTFDVTATVTGPGTYAFAVEGIEPGRATIFASEHGEDGPRLVVTWVPNPGNGKPGAGRDKVQGAPPVTDPSAVASAGITPAVGPSGSTVGNVGPLPAVPRGRTLAGASIMVAPGETYAQAVARADRTYGPLEMVRVFYPGLPPAWGNSRADVAAGGSGRTTVVSFKGHPRDVNAGKHDGQLAAWFASAPRNRDIYWVYFHEPEDDIARGSFTFAEYRSAWRRVAAIGSRSGGARMYPTLVLMCFSLNPGSGRNWRDYYPGDDAIAVLGWDCYNHGRKKGEYTPPAGLYAKSIEVSRSVGKPFGYAEMGSVLLPGDSGTGRAAWIRSVGTYLNAQGPLWMSYYDSQTDADFRLLDAPSQQAWSAVCRS